MTTTPTQYCFALRYHGETFATIADTKHAAIRGTLYMLIPKHTYNDWASRLNLVANHFLYAKREVAALYNFADDTYEAILAKP